MDHLATLFTVDAAHEAFVADIEMALAVLEQGRAAFQAYMVESTKIAAATLGLDPPTFPDAG